MIKEYRKQLDGYQVVLNSQLQEKNKVISDLQFKVDDLSKQNDNCRQQISDLMIENQMLETTKEGLLS